MCHPAPWAYVHTNSLKTKIQNVGAEATPNAINIDN